MAVISAADFVGKKPVQFVKVISSKGTTNVLLGDDGNVYTLKGGAGGIDSRNNNPGAMKYGSRARAFGAIGQTAPPPGSPDGLGYAIFPSYAAGVAAYADLQQQKNGNKTIADMVKSYAVDEALPAYKNYAADLAKAAGVSTSTKISDLTPQQFALLQAKQFEIEGAGTGKLVALDANGKPVASGLLATGHPIPPGFIPETGVASATSTTKGGKDATRALQQQLKAAGFNPGEIDGINGPKTQAALKAFQAANGLKVDGIVGPQTTAALQRAATSSMGDYDAFGRATAPAAPAASPNASAGTVAHSRADSNIADIQFTLKAKGYDVGAVDGINGPKTQAAIKAFQAANGLKVDGIVGPQTLAAMAGQTNAFNTAQQGSSVFDAIKARDASWVAQGPDMAALNASSNAFKNTSTGAAKPSVTAIQQQLAAAGYSPGAIDGIQGKNTDAAIRAFQQANGLAVDGIVGPKTLAALQSATTSTMQTGGSAARPTTSITVGGGTKSSSSSSSSSNAFKTASGKTITAGQQVALSGGRTATVQADGSLKDNATGRISKGAS